MESAQREWGGDQTSSPPDDSKGLDTVAQIKGRTVKKMTTFNSFGVVIDTDPGHWLGLMIDHPDSFEGIYVVDETQTVYTARYFQWAHPRTVLVEFEPEDSPVTDAETENWMTVSSHPSSGLRYEEENRVTVYARITQDGHEVVSPSPNVESVYAQYNARVQREIERIVTPHSFHYGYQRDLNAGTDKPQNWVNHCTHCDQTFEGGPHI